jgi:hypothetical protein
LESQWVLEKSNITYKVTHPLHVVHGNSLSAKGKGVCYSDGRCVFLVAVPVKSFDSGDNNRDLHMLEVTKAGLFPMIEVNVELKGSDGSSAVKKITADVKVKFAGKTAEYPEVQLDILEQQLSRVHLSGRLPLTLKDFDIQPPALLTIPIRDEIPVQLDMWWKRADWKQTK